MATITDLNAEKHVKPLDWGAIQWMCGNIIDSEAEMTFGISFGNSGASNKRHLHPNCEELIFVISGECVHSLGDETYHLKPGMMLRIPQNVPHGSNVVSWEPCKTIILFSSGDRKTIVLEY